MKTIMMTDPVPEEPGSRVPMTNITAVEAEQWAAKQGARLPTPEEYDRLFAIEPWPHLVWEWTSTADNDMRLVRGGSWYDLPRYARASVRHRYDPAYRYMCVGFRLVRDILADAPVPTGWVVIREDK